MLSKLPNHILMYTKNIQIKIIMNLVEFYQNEYMLTLLIIYITD